jgi:cell division protein ZapE
MTEHIPGTLERYEALVTSGELRPNPGQEMTAGILNQLQIRVEGSSPERDGLFSRILGLGKAKEAELKNVYLYGPVGRGKTTMMDLFHDSLVGVSKRRVHFHAFMLEVHNRIHTARSANLDQEDSITPLAAEISKETKVLCFDEFVINNIADAMILGRLYEALRKNGTVMVMTSNFPPDRLYEGGLQRERFMPFIDLLKETTDQVLVDHQSDYRVLNMRLPDTYFVPNDEFTENRLRDSFSALTGGEAGETRTLMVGRRELIVPRANGRVALFHFSDLCARALGTADYLKISDEFDTVIIAGVPRMGPDRRNEARRFMTMIDAFYDCKVQTVIGADATPEQLYPSGDGSFEFQRTVSRMIEMQSEHYGS